MATRNELFPSKYLKAADLGGMEHTLTIASVDIEEVGMDKETKPVLKFRDDEKGVILNATNYDNIALQYGEETRNWSGLPVVLRPEKTRFGGKIVDCIRAYPMQAQQQQPAPQQPAPAPQPASQPYPQPAQAAPASYQPAQAPYTPPPAQQATPQAAPVQQQPVPQVAAPQAAPEYDPARPFNDEIPY